MFVGIAAPAGAPVICADNQTVCVRKRMNGVLFLFCLWLTSEYSSSAFGFQDATSPGREPTEISNEEPGVLNQSDAESGKSTAQESVNSIEQPPPIPRILNGAAVIGKPYGAGRLTIPIGKHSVWRADQPISVQARGDRLLFPCHHVRPGDQGDELVIHFLFRGDEALVVDVASASVTFADGLIRVDEGHASHKTLIDDWWSNYAKQLVHGPSEELSRIGRDTVTMLGRQLGLRAWWPRGSSLAQSSELEKQFERTMGMLLGFESVRLAMMKDTSAVTTDEGPAALKLPRPFQMRAVPVPEMPPNSMKIERLAFHVPSEYFYLRCQSLRNYLWMRNLVKGWGGSLDQMVATPVVEHRVRERIERQLCLDPSLALALDLDASLDDFAIVGGDTYFAEGAALGVLMLTNKPARVESILDEMRRSMAASASARHRTLTISDRTVSLYETSDNSIRSFYAVSGDCHLVTNSAKLVQHFFDCDSGQNLASLAEFRYARSKFPLTRDITSFLYLSDPFFRRLTSPATRIEASRRQRAAAELRQLKLARLLFAAQGLDGDGSLANLVQHRLLEATFGTRADGSFPDFRQDGQVVDSLRGGLGTFLPIADVAVSKATGQEVRSYAEFIRNYRREWAAMDPVAVALHRHAGDDSSEETVNLEIAITPYAREAYQFLSRHLAPSSNQQIKPPESDVLTLTTRLQGATTFDVCVGLSDATVPFRIEKGQLIREGDFANRTFSDWQSYAAVTPASINGLQLLGDFTQALQSREIPSASKSPYPGPKTIHNLWDYLENAIHYRRYIATAGLKLMLGAVDLSRINSDEEWTVMARNGVLRGRVVDDLVLMESTARSQLQFRMGDVNSANIGPYLHAVSWEAGRRLSGENAAWVNRFATITRLDLNEARNQLEQVLGGKLCCPLGGMYEIRQNGPTSQLISTAWGSSSRFDETSVPADYQLPFLMWLRKLTLDFELSATTLTSRVELRVRPTIADETSPMADRTRTETRSAAIVKAVATKEREQLYRQLLVADRQLSRALRRIDSSGAWNTYLAVPPQLPHGDYDWEKLHAALRRFQRVASDPMYQVITDSAGFAESHTLLKECIATIASDNMN